MTVALVLPLLAGLSAGVSTAPFALVRFTCDQRAAARRAERAWNSPAVVSELARGWSIDVRDACEHAEEFERLVGERGVLAACALDPNGGVIGVLRGPADAERCAEFLTACRAELGRERDPLERIDAAITLGAWSAASEELRCLAGPELDGEGRDLALASLLERRARLEVLRGDVASAACSLEAARRAGIDDLPAGRTRAAVTATLIALAARRVGEARERIPGVIADVEPAPCELDALLRIATALHESGEDALALELGTAVETKNTSNAVQRSIDTLREHVALGTNDHAH